MAETVINSTIEVLLEPLITFSKEQIRLVRDYKEDFENLEKSFMYVKAFLRDAEKKKITSEAFKIWLKDLEDLAFEADNVFDDISYQLLARKVGPTRNITVMEKVMISVISFCCSWNDPTVQEGLQNRLELGARIKDIKERLLSINQQAREFGLQTCSILNSQPLVSAIPLETNSFAADPSFFGRENDVSMIVKKLTTAAAEKVLSVLPIVGMGGLGKTTLARKVFHHEQIISHFGDKRRVWVHVPRNFDVSNILKKILNLLSDEKVELETSEEALLKKLEQHMRTGRYLLVLDDVWNEEMYQWESFVNSLSGISSATGNCMIVTTRSENVASIVKTLPVHKLKGLSKEYCWSIIEAKALIREGDDPSEFKKIGINIAGRCQGLPLAAKVVGGLLRNKSKDEWRNIEMNWLSDFGDDQTTISKILKLSFDHLSSPSLKKCFAYCSIFPKGYQIEKQKLIELWMAEGFIQNSDHGRSHINMETTGSKIFNLLLWNSLLQVARSDDYGNVTHCNMHDLVHDLAFSVLYENDNVTCGVCRSRYIGYESSGDRFLSIPEGQERYVRTLFFRGKVSDIMFPKFESLHSLTLVGYEIDELPTSIRKLKHLRYLDISETSIKYLSDSIAELYHLQTLRAKNKWGFNHLKKLPNSLSLLISLRHLHIPGGTSLPPEIGKLTSLQTLSRFDVRNEKGCGISELGNLKELKGELEIHNLGNVPDKNEAMRANLSQKAGIYKLRLVWDKYREGDEINDKSVLEELKPHPNLKVLEIYGFKGKSLPFWDGLNNLVKIKLDECNVCEELPNWLFSNNHNLTKLHIKGCSKITHLVPHLGGSGGGKQLQSFTSLRKLCIEDCEELTNLPIEMVESCTASLEKLKLIELRSITNLGMVIECLHKLTRLRELVIDGVPKFSSSKDIIGTNNNLRKLEMGPSSSDSSWNNVSFNETIGAIILPQSIGSLRELTLTGKEDWDSLPDQLQHLTSLEELWLWNLGIEALPEWFGNLSSLEKLYLWECKKLRHLPSKQAMQRLSKLTNLWMDDCQLLLKEENRSNNNNNNELPQIVDSEWPKISHIPQVFVNGFQIPSDE